jgi:DNA-nicking Smr family endonuclease
MRRRRDRTLKAEERALWRAVTSSVKPLSRPEPPIEGGGPVGEQSASPKLPHAAPPRAKAGHAGIPKPAPPLPLPHRPPPAPKRPESRLSAGDGRLAKNVARGRREIDAVLDLHGLTQDQAFARLRRFIELGAASGARTLLIVTGKGSGEAPLPFDQAPRGILRRRFLEWVEHDPLRGRIAAVRPAHRRHGGSGAFYLFLKRERAGS